MSYENPLVNEHPADTLIQIQSVLFLIQDFAEQTAEIDNTSLHNVRTYHGISAILTSINDALDHEIKRLENYKPLTVVK